MSFLDYKTLKKKLCLSLPSEMQHSNFTGPGHVSMFVLVISQVGGAVA